MAPCNPEKTKDYVQAILMKHGYPEQSARISGEILVEADMRGVYSHGVNSLDLIIIPSIAGKCTVPNARCIDRTRDRRYCIRHLDAAGGPGHASSRKAVTLVKKLAREHGMGRVFVYSAGHFGAAGIYSEEIAAERDLEGRVFCTSSVHAALPGSDQVSVGTNPIAWTIPYADGFVTLDMATTVHAASGICKAIRDGADTLPFAVYDENRKLTVDPRSFADVKSFLEKGSIPHLGTCTGDLMADKDDVSYKGMGMGILVALICSSSGSPLTTVTASAHDEKRRVIHGFEASRIDTLFPQDKALERISSAVSFYRGMGPTMKLPGQIETETKARSLREGIVYSEEQILRLRRLGEEVGVDPDAFL